MWIMTDSVDTNLVCAIVCGVVFYLKWNSWIWAHIYKAITLISLEIGVL